MSRKFKILLIFTFFSLWSSLYAQTPSGGKSLHVNSPYSQIGIGDLAPAGNLRNIGMGFTGVSYGNPEFLNTMNPALLINNRIKSYDSLLTILDASILGQARFVSNKNTSEWTRNVNFNSVAYAFPVNRNWTTSIGIRPFSSVNYSLLKKQAVSGSPVDTASIQNIGYGGIYQADWSNGIKIKRNISLGIQASYLFGSIYHESVSQITTHANPLTVGTNDKTYYSGFLIRPGLAIRKKLQSHHVDSSVFVNFGFTYDLFSNIHTQEKLLITSRSVINTIVGQTTAQSASKNIIFPPIYRAGLSFNKGMDWNVAAEVSYSDWTKYNGSTEDTMKSSYTISLGGEFSFLANEYVSKRNYIRAGVSYSKTPYVVSGHQIDDIALTLGYTFPVGKVKAFSLVPLPKLNAGLVMGHRGTKDDNLVSDFYFKAYVGVTINDKWFRRRRVE